MVDNLCNMLHVFVHIRIWFIWIWPSIIGRRHVGWYTFLWFCHDGITRADDVGKDFKRQLTRLPSDNRIVHDTIYNSGDMLYDC